MVSNETILWENLRLGGHSQGSGHALYISKYWDTAHSCLLGGPYGVPDSVPNIPAQAIADWYLDDSVTVDMTKIRALTSVDDDYYAQFVTAYGVLGLEENVHWVSFSAERYKDIDGNDITGHGAVVHDPAFAALRRNACFEPIER